MSYFVNQSLITLESNCDDSRVVVCLFCQHCQANLIKPQAHCLDDRLDDEGFFSVKHEL